MQRSIIWLCLVMSAQLYGQSDSAALRKLRNDSTRIFRYNEVLPYLKVEQRHTFISLQPLNFYGLMAGVTISQRHILSAGAYMLDVFTARPLYVFSEGTIRFNSVYHANFSYQLIAYNSRYFQLTFPLEAGTGFYNVSTDLGDRPELQPLYGIFIPFGGGVQTSFKPLKWLGISSLIGYRRVLQSAQMPAFHGWYFSVALWYDGAYLLRTWRYSRVKKAYRERAAHQH